MDPDVILVMSSENKRRKEQKLKCRKFHLNVFKSF